MEQTKPWEDDEVELVKAEVLKGSTSSFIGSLLGRSRNSVIGKIHRLGLGGGKRQKTGNQCSKKKAKPKNNEPILPAFKGPRSEYVEAVDVPPHERRGLLDRLDNQCMWPIGDPKDPGFHYCNHDRVLGQQYCAHHMAISSGKTRRAGPGKRARSTGDEFKEVY